MNIEDVTVTFTDIRAVIPSGGCVNGYRLFAKQANIDFRTAIKEGIPASKLLATGDFRAEAAVNYALERLKNG
jgi:hypothetical protein